MTTTNTHLSLRSYDFSRCNNARRLFATSSSGDSDPSPGTSIQANAPCSFKPLRPSLPSSLTYEQKSKNKVLVQAIEERSERGSARSVESSLQHTHKAKLCKTSYKLGSVKIQTSGSAPHTPGSETPSRLHLALENGPPLPGKSSSPSSSQKVKRPVWMRTPSGGVWYRQNQQISSQDGSSVLSFRSASPTSGRDERDSITIIPLKPPPRPEILPTGSNHCVVVDKPFERLDETVKNSGNIQQLGSQNSQRDRTFDVRNLFSVSLPIFHRRGRKVSADHKLVSLRLPGMYMSSTNVQGHKSLLKRERTGTILERVSAVLENSSAPLRNRMRTWTHKSQSSSGSSDNIASSNSAVKTVMSIPYVQMKDSPDNIASSTSSVLNLHMGLTPRNSPSELATYKIKRTRSAETEEFFKIDISVRGQTSYLPSEARRIHTPPLPEDYSSRSARGFFFDYKCPGWTEACNESVIPLRSDHPSDQSGTEARATRYVPTSSIRIHQPQYSSRIQARDSVLRLEVPHKQGTGDWYDTCFSRIDVSPSTLDITAPYFNSEKHYCKSEEQLDLTEIKRRRYEALLDYSIPEHLPSSPLCPRNPKYWRMVKGKGSQFRGCWMHGYGVYETVPGVTKVGPLLQDEE